MKVVGFNLTNVSANRKHKMESLARINQTIKFTDVEEHDAKGIKEGTILKICFKYALEYEPENADITLEGVMFLHAKDDAGKDLLDEWKKDQKIEKDEYRIPLFNAVITRCHLKALNLEDQLGLPPHAAVPKLQKKIQ